jgi:hypothetical protein
MSEFAGIEKKINQSKKLASRSFVQGKVPVTSSDSGSQDKPQKSSNKTTFNNPRALRAALQGMT